MRAMPVSILCGYLLSALIAMSQPAMAETLPITAATVPQTPMVLAPTDPVAQSIQALLLPLDRSVSAAMPAQTMTHQRLDVALAVAEFYRNRAYAAVWSDDRDTTQLLEGLSGLEADGLAPGDFQLAELSAAKASLTDATPAAERGRFDVAATSAYVSALLQLRRGKVDPATLDMQWNFDPAGVDPREEVSGLFDALLAHDVANAFRQAPPQMTIYSRMRMALAQLRETQARGGWPLVEPTQVLKFGVIDPAVTQLRLRLIAGGYLDASLPLQDRYDEIVVSAVRKYQSEQYLSADGVVSRETLASLNVPVQVRIDQVRVNLERARWLLYKLQGTFVIVDIAGYKVALYRDGQPIWRSRVQVGKPFRSTPVFQAEITYITFNPTWTVPPTILKNDVLPQILKNPRYLDAHRIQVLNGTGEVIDPATVNWHKPGGVTLRQQAGPENSLGQVVIRFPNPYAIYLHDTPHRELFNQNRRATSSGCIRVENPLQLVELLFNDPVRWNAAAIQEQLATGVTTNINLPVKVPVLLAYWTVDLQDDARLSFKPDVYGHDRVVLQALNRPVSTAFALPEQAQTGRAAY